MNEADFCRGFGHDWPNMPRPQDVRTVAHPQYALAIEIQTKCRTCGSIRKKYLDAWTRDLLRNSYAYSEGYPIRKGQGRATKADFAEHRTRAIEAISPSIIREPRQQLEKVPGLRSKRPSKRRSLRQSA